MSGDECDRYKQFFVEADTDNDGQLSLEELTAALRHRGYAESDLKIKAMFDSVDDSGDRLISLDEYLKAMGQIPDKDHKIAAMHRVFREFDKNGDGEIDKSELEAVFKEMGKSVPQEEIDRIIAAADRDGNKKLNYEEFIRDVFQ
jgi:Ca2+-binding EF-hand superfamily protein